MNKVIARISIILLILSLIFQTLVPLVTYAQTNQLVNDEFILFKTSENIVVEDSIIINKGTLVYGQKINEEDVVNIQFGESHVTVLLENLIEVDLMENEVPGFVEINQLENAKKQAINKEQSLYALYPDEGVRIQFTGNIEYPVYHDELGLEVVYIGNVAFYLSADDRQNVMETIEDKEAEELPKVEETAEDEFVTDEEEETESQTEELVGESGQLSEGKELEEVIKAEEKNKLLENNEANYSEREESLASEEFVNNLLKNSVTFSNETKVAVQNTNNAWKNSSAKYFKVNIDNLTVYSKGNTKVLGTLTKGQVYPIDSNYGNWHQIQFGKSKGYVYKANTLPDNGAELKNKNTRYSHSKQSFVALQDAVVYDNSSGQLVEFAKIKSGESYPIVSAYGSNWSRIILSDRVGYVLNSQVRHKFVGGEKYFTVLVSNLPIYDNRSGSLRQVGTLTKGQSYEIVANYGNWHRIQYNNHYGYVYKASTEPSNGAYIRNKNSGYKHSNSRFKALQNMIVYDNTGSKLKAFGTIDPGQTYYVTSDYGNWWRIIFADRVGYVHKSGVELLVTKIFLDPGHGAHDPGGIGFGLREKDVVLDIGLKTANYLRSNYYDVEVKLSRTTDKFVTLGNRSKMANEWGADYFVSLHTNAHNGSANGFESFIYNGGVSQDTINRQKDIHNYLMKRMNVLDRGMKRANFSVLRNSKMPAILLEYLFIDNYANNQLLSSTSYRSTLAKITAEAIANSYGLTAK